MRPPAASKRSSPRINARTKLTIPSLVRHRKCLFGSCASTRTKPNNPQSMCHPINFSRFWSGDENKCDRRAILYPFYYRISNHGSMSTSILFALRYYVVYAGRGMDAVAMGVMQGIHSCCIKSFYGRLSIILSNFDREKTVPFSGLIREICYGEPTEWVEPLRRQSVFHGFNRAVTIHTELSVFFIMSRSGAERGRYPHVGKLADYCGVDTRP